MFSRRFISPGEVGYFAHYNQLKNECSASRFRLEVLEYLFQQKFSLPASLATIEIHILSELIYLIRFHQDYLAHTSRNDRDGTHKKDITPMLIRNRQQNERAISIIVALFSNQEKIFDYSQICEARERIKAERESHHLTFNLFDEKPARRTAPEPKRFNALPPLRPER